MSGRNDHGWNVVGSTLDGGVVSVGRAVDGRSCDCDRPSVLVCLRVATQEDLLCDECRQTCAQWDGNQ